MKNGAEASPEQLKTLQALKDTEVAFLEASGWRRRGGGWVKKADTVPFTTEEAVAVERRLLARAALIKRTEEKNG